MLNATLTKLHLTVLLCNIDLANFVQNKCWHKIWYSKRKLKFSLLNVVLNKNK